MRFFHRKPGRTDPHSKASQALITYNKITTSEHVHTHQISCYPFQTWKGSFQIWSFAIGAIFGAKSTDTKRTLPESEVGLLRDGRPPIFQDLDVGGTSASPIPVAWDQLRAIRDRKENRMGMELNKNMGFCCQESGEDPVIVVVDPMIFSIYIGFGVLYTSQAGLCTTTRGDGGI